MLVPVDDRRIHDEHVPAMPAQQSWIHHCLRRDGLHEVIQSIADVGVDVESLGLAVYLDVCLNRCEEFAPKEQRIKLLPTTEIPVLS